jgi:hypothetical protein
MIIFFYKNTIIKEKAMSVLYEEVVKNNKRLSV